MKQTARQTAQWILAFATALIFCSPFFLRGGPKAASGAVLQTTAPAAAPDVAWRPNDDKARGVSAPRYNGVERASRYITLTVVIARGQISQCPMNVGRFPER